MFASGHLPKNQEGLLTTPSVTTEGPLKIEDEGVWDPFGLLCLLYNEHGKTRTRISCRGRRRRMYFWNGGMAVSPELIHNQFLDLWFRMGERLTAVVFGTLWSRVCAPVNW